MKYKIVMFFGLYLIFLLIVSISEKSFPQTGLLMSVYGWIKNIETGNSIQGIIISLFKTTENEKYIFISDGTSDENGFYKLRPLESGTYHFSIEIPGRGIVYIGFIEFGGITEDYYKLEIKDGENKNLNIFLGESELPDIKREEFQNGGRIDFTMIIDKEVEPGKTGKSAVVKSLEIQQAIEEGYKGLRIIQDPNLNLVRDDIKLGKEDKGGRYEYSIKLSEASASFDGRTCKFPPQKAILKGWIKIHSFEWSRKKMNIEREENGLPPYSDDYIRCKYDCLIVHERTHMDLAPERAKSAWDNFLKNLSLYQQNV